MLKCRISLLQSLLFAIFLSPLFIFINIFPLYFLLLPCDGRGPGDGAVAWHGRVVLNAGHGVGRVKVVVVNAGHGRA